MFGAEQGLPDERRGVLYLLEALGRRRPEPVEAVSPSWRLSGGPVPGYDRHAVGPPLLILGEASCAPAMTS